MLHAAKALTAKDFYVPLSGVATVGANARRIREAQGLTQEVIAARLKLKKPAQMSIMESARRLPKPLTIVKWAEALDTEPSALLKDVETDYDRIRKNLPIAQKAQPLPARKIAVGESPPVAGRRPARSRSAHSR